MKLSEFMNRIIEDGIQSAAHHYRHDDDKRAGAIAGFMACRGKEPAELADLLVGAEIAARVAKEKKNSRAQEVVCFHAEVHWVCNCVSAALNNQGLRPIIRPTANAVLKAAEIAGIQPVHLSS